jgi:tRNA-uridine 2-sulfurtransferase
MRNTCVSSKNTYHGSTSMATQDPIEQLIERALSRLPAHATRMRDARAQTGTAPVVYMGMSGGVDSSVSAYLLKRAGYDVRGVFIKTWQPDDIICTWKEDRRDAMRVCAQLGIPFETVHAEDEYKTYVVDYMIREYAAGRTPNPDIMCNKHVKFGVFFDYARAQGADFVATGHYAMTRERTLLEQGESVGEGTVRETGVDMIRSVDENKDQTYFLWAISADQIAHTLFPVGGLLKSEVREIATYAGLHVSQKKDSQGVCFIGKIDMKDFIKQHVTVVPGDVWNMNGEVIGTHEGSLLYTIGERHGFQLHNQSPHTEPHFVIKKDIDANRLYVGTERELLASKSNSEMVLEQVHLNSPCVFPAGLHARFRHRQPLQSVNVSETESVSTDKKDAQQGALSGTSLGQLHVVCAHPQSGIASGQSCVLYDGEICLGGGIISSYDTPTSNPS